MHALHSTLRWSVISPSNVPSTGRIDIGWGNDTNDDADDQKEEGSTACSLDCDNDVLVTDVIRPSTTLA